MRPLLAFAAGEVSRRGRASGSRSPARAVELIHAYSLVHDDMPCMDDDVLRRGKPTVHVEYDEATALLVGDALQSLAFQLLAEHRARRRRRSASSRWCASLARRRRLARHGGRAADRPRGDRQGADACPSSSSCTSTRPARSSGAAVHARLSLRRDVFRAGKSQARHATPRPSASPSRSSTTCSTATPAPRRSARPPARTAKQGKPTYVSRDRPAARARRWLTSCVRSAQAAIAELGARAQSPRGARRLHRSAKILSMSTLTGDLPGRRSRPRRRLQSVDVRAAEDASTTRRSCARSIAGSCGQLADELRAYVLESVSKTGGHLSSNLGTVELTIALHYVFDTPEDRIVWDVGHQTYAHKILTGRREADVAAAHAATASPASRAAPNRSTTPSAPRTRAPRSRAALGMAVAAKLKGEKPALHRRHRRRRDVGGHGLRGDEQRRRDGRRTCW